MYRAGDHGYRAAACMKERCTVSLELVAEDGVDASAFTAVIGVEPTRVRRDPGQPQVWAHTVKGPSPVTGGRVANDLARELLRRLNAAGRGWESWDRTGVRAIDVRFELAFDRLLSFSYELDPEVVCGLAGLRASVGFYHRDGTGDESLMEPFGTGASPEEGCEASLRILGEHSAPDAATRGLGVVPSSAGRTSDGSRSFWVLEGGGPRARNADDPIIDLLARLPTKSEAWGRLCHEHQVHVMVAFRVRHMTGYFDLEASTMRALADSGCGLDASFYDWGPHGADLL